MKKFTVIINEEEFQVEENDSSSIPWKLYQKDRKKTFYAHNGIQHYRVLDWYGNLFAEIEKALLDNPKIQKNENPINHILVRYTVSGGSPFTPFANNNLGDAECKVPINELSGTYKFYINGQELHGIKNCTWDDINKCEYGIYGLTQRNVDEHRANLSNRHDSYGVSPIKNLYKNQFEVDQYLAWLENEYRTSS